MNLLFRLILMAFLGAVLGALSALWFGGLISGAPNISKGVDVNGWSSDWAIGSENANPYVRARVARNGLFALRKEEAVYFVATTDDDGARLVETCTYRVSGGPFPAAWWSITLYDGDSRLPMNTDQRLSFDQTQAAGKFQSPNQDWQFQVSASAPETAAMPWVSSRSAGTFDLTLRLYQPSAALLSAPNDVLRPPRIERVTCGPGAT
ncbi:MAG: DUF1214 domain-containing protein [Pseudomonadota bacterium]